MSAVYSLWLKKKFFRPGVRMMPAGFQNGDEPSTASAL